MPTSAAAEFLSGVKAELPILLGVAPFGMIYGALAISAGLPAGMAQAMSAIVFAGSAQFIAAQLIGGGAPALVLLLTTFIVNIRHMLYSASIAPYFRTLRPAWKWLLAYLLTDEAYAIAIIHYQQTENRMNHGGTEITELSLSGSPCPPSHGEASHCLRGESITPPDCRHWYFLGAGLALWTTWQVSTAAGILLGARVPSSWSLEFALPLTFIALLAPILRDRPAVAAAVAAGAVAVIGAGWPYKLGLVAAALAGIAVGVWMDRQGAALEGLR
jgi:predicted branched-subunit amino acid permease